MKNDMKKIAKLMTVLAVAAFTFASCEDVPNPFGPVTPPTTDGDDTNTELPYTSVNLNSGWTLEAVSADQPWSQGSSYVQATGYQKWDGAESKTNRAVKGWLVSPAFSTKGYENVKIFFEQTIKYTSYTGWEANHKVFVTSNYDESNFSATTWVEITDFKPVASPYESKDWTLYSSGELQLPASMTGQEAIHIGFYFEAPADKSTTWELKNFNIAEGIADNSGSSDEPSGDPDMGKEDKPYDVASAIAAGDKTGVYVKGYIVGTAFYNQDAKKNEFNFGTTNAQATNFMIATTATEIDATKCMVVALPTAVRSALNLVDNASNLGKEVLLYGNITKYFGQPGVKETSYAILDGTAIGTKPGTTPTGAEAKGTGTESDPFNVAAAVAKCKEVGTTASTDKYYIKGIANAEFTVTSNKYVDLDLVDAEGNTEKFKLYHVKDKDGKGIKEGYKIAKGATIIVYGPVQNYMSNTPETATGAYLVSVNGQAPELDGDAGGDTGGGDTGGGDAGSNLVTNGGFENWAEGAPVDWNGPAANSPAISESNDAHEGTKSILFEGNPSTNKRLSSKKMKLKAGTYSISLYAKATEGEVKIAPGYVAFKSDGTLDSQNYKYPTDYPVVPTTWTLVTHSFTLEADTEICLVIMKHKSTTASILLDEYSLTTTDGGLVE